MSFKVSLDRAIKSSLILILAVSLANADLNILAIGDSHTVGKNDTTNSIFRSSYRPYLDQSIRNFQSLGINDADTVTVNWLGNAGATTGPIPHDSPIAVDSNWTNRHLAESGVAARGYDQSDAVAALNGTAAGDRNLVLMLLGSNEFGMFTSNEPSSFGWSSNDFTPTRVVDSISAIIADFPTDTETLIAAIPPVDERRRYLAKDPSTNFDGKAGNLWFESERIISGGHQDLVHWDGSQFVIGGGQDVDSSGNPLPAPLDASSNDIIDAVNYALFQLADSDPNVTFVDPFLSGGGYELQGPAVTPASVNSGLPFNRTPDNVGQLDLLTDGIHLSPVAEQYYAAAFWQGGVRAAISEVAAAQAVPEPTSFLFLGLLSMLAASARRFFGLSDATERD